MQLVLQSILILEHLISLWHQLVSGSGWSAGNVIRFNTVGANYPVDIARTVLKSDPSILTDSFRLAIRGDIDR